MCTVDKARQGMLLLAGLDNEACNKSSQVKTRPGCVTLCVTCRLRRSG